MQQQAPITENTKWEPSPDAPDPFPIPYPYSKREAKEQIKIIKTIMKEFIVRRDNIQKRLLKVFKI